MEAKLVFTEILMETKMCRNLTVFVLGDSD